MKVNAIKDGNGNIVITEDSFEMLLACLDNQKFIDELPQNGDSISVGEREFYKTQQDMQNVIDLYNRGCRDILHQKYLFILEDDGYFLTKKYQLQDEVIPWSSVDVDLVRTLFKDTVIIYDTPTDIIPLDGSEMIKDGDVPIGKDAEGWIICEPEPSTWLIERSLRCDYKYLTISENGRTNRPWKQEEIDKIVCLFNGL